MTWTELVFLVCGVNATPQLPNQLEAVQQETGVNREVLLAIVKHESECDPNARGRDGDSGLMQIIPKYHKTRIRALGVDDIFDPLDNLRVGATTLVELGFQSDPLQALRIYNGGIKPPRSSWTYAVTIMETAREYVDKQT